ncbi:hypothetical protein [Vibrio alginolyticus]|uniref:hypothetical protein n=1 Tax=Vibrio alginolyticus TaxID=663 RepID=UPI001303B8E0|nr:hypothetical protein [Vibrio alginolyticus]ELP9501604.1 hypothetical protein [Vibrio alginolyticus]
MRKFDKPLFWLYIKTRDSLLSSFKGFLGMLLVLIGAAVVLGNESPENVWISVGIILLVSSLPVSMGLMMVKFKFKSFAGSIPTAELAYFLQHDEGANSDKAVRGLFSLSLSFMIYLWFTMVAIAALGTLGAKLVL